MSSDGNELSGPVGLFFAARLDKSDPSLRLKDQAPTDADGVVFQNAPRRVLIWYAAGGVSFRAEGSTRLNILQT